MRHTHYWFEPEDGKIGPDDEREPVVGRTHLPRRDRDIADEVLASYATPRDALKHNVKPIIWGVIPGGDEWGSSTRVVDKKITEIMTTERTYIWSQDVTEVLDIFGRSCLVDILHLWEETPSEIVTYLEVGTAAAKKEAIISLNDVDKSFELITPASFVERAIRKYISDEESLVPSVSMIGWWCMQARSRAGEEQQYVAQEERLERMVLQEYWRNNPA